MCVQMRWTTTLSCVWCAVLRVQSMNSVMDDNKVLTLVSNERIPLTPEMRMLFEVATLEHATPATVSRAGILYLNDTDVSWRALVRARV